jgi:2'-5' RNA ligase
MQGIVTLLDAPDRERIEGIWEELRRDFGVRGIHTRRFPHFSYHVAEKYDLDRVHAKLEEVGRKMQPFTVRTSGIGIFTRKQPVIHLPVVRTPAIEMLRQQITHSVQDLTETPNEYYAEDIWIPHVTIAEGDVDLLVLPSIVRQFGDRNLQWEMRVTNFAVIRAAEDVQEICFRCEFGEAKA